MQEPGIGGVSELENFASKSSRLSTSHHVAWKVVMIAAIVVLLSSMAWLATEMASTRRRHHKVDERYTMLLPY